MLVSTAVIDLHCHIAFGLDDGPRQIEEAREMAEGLAALGFRTVAATPHLPWGSYLTDADTVRKKLSERLEALRALCPGIELVAGAEHHSDLLPALLAKERPICYPGGGCFLLELPLSGFPGRLEDLLFRIEVRGLRAALAHAERYPEVQREPARLEIFRSRGFPVLVNLGSLAGDWGRDVARAARELLKNGRGDALTSDLHSAAQLESIAEGLRLARELVDAEEFLRLTEVRPKEILRREPSA